MAKESQNTKKRSPIASGLLYPETASSLKNALELLLHDTRPSNDSVFGIVVPHASLDYSGEAAAKAWAYAAGGSTELVVLLGPRHSKGDARLILPESSTFEIPGAEISVETDLIEELRACSTLFSVDDVPHLEEHSIEMQLPFVAALFPRAKIVPILFGAQHQALATAASRALELVLGSRSTSTLYAATCDFTLRRGDVDAEKKALEAIARARSADLDFLEEELRSGDRTSCASACLLTLCTLAAEMGAVGVELCRSESPAGSDNRGEARVIYASLAFELGRAERDSDRA
jgi:hypothetical protein